MKVIINKHGELLMHRGGVWKKMMCPYTIQSVLIEHANPNIYPEHEKRTYNYSECNTFCPHFQEPKIINDHVVVIKLCNGTVIECPVGDFEDKSIPEKRNEQERV